MSHLLVKPSGTSGKVHDITPESARWGYVGFGLYHLEAGQSASEETGDKEVILVLVEGKASISAGDESFGELGDRMSVFERKKPQQSGVLHLKMRRCRCAVSLIALTVARSRRGCRDAASLIDLLHMRPIIPGRM